MATTLIRNAQAIVTVDREDRVLRNDGLGDRKSTRLNSSH